MGAMLQTSLDVHGCQGEARNLCTATATESRLARPAPSAGMVAIEPQCGTIGLAGLGAAPVAGKALTPSGPQDGKQSRSQSRTPCSSVG